MTDALSYEMRSGQRSANRSEQLPHGRVASRVPSRSFARSGTRLPLWLLLVSAVALTWATRLPGYLSQVVVAAVTVIVERGLRSLERETRRNADSGRR